MFFACFAELEIQIWKLCIYFCYVWTQTAKEKTSLFQLNWKGVLTLLFAASLALINPALTFSLLAVVKLQFSDDATNFRQNSDRQLQISDIENFWCSKILMLFLYFIKVGCSAPNLALFGLHFSDSKFSDIFLTAAWRVSLLVTAFSHGVQIFAKLDVPSIYAEVFFCVETRLSLGSFGLSSTFFA